MNRVVQLKDINGNIYPKVKREFISVGLNNQINNINDELYQLSFDKIINKNTDKLSLENGKIKIGKNVKNIKIDFSVFCERRPQNGYIWAYIMIKNNWICNSIEEGALNFSTLKSQSTIIEVKEDDEIVFIINGTFPVRPISLRAGNNTFLTVEIIE